MQTIDRSVRIAEKAVRQAIITRKCYNSDDVEFVVQSLLVNSDETGITIEIVAKFCIRCYLYSNTGRYSFSFNAILKRVVDIRDSDGIVSLAKMSDTEAFPELYNNISLTTDEKSKILSMTSREYLSTVNMINMAAASFDDHIELFGESISVKQYKSTSSVDIHKCLYNTAYKYVMMQELASVTLGGNIFPVTSSPPETIMIKGESTVTSELTIKEVDYLYFILQLTKESDTMKDIRLSKELVTFMKKKYSPEIKLCQYWTNNPL